MTCDLVALCIDANDPQRMAEFWAGVLGWEVDHSGADIGLLPADDTGFRLRFPRTSEPAVGPNQFHFDLTSAQALGEALILRVERRVVGPVHAQQGLHGEAGIGFLQLGGGVPRLLHVAGPSVVGGEVEVWVPRLRNSRGRLAAPFDRVLPLGQVGVQMADIVLPPRHRRIARAQTQRLFDAREAVLAATHVDLSEARISVSTSAITGQPKRPP